MKDRILLTGGHGLLGSYLKFKAERPTQKEFDITDFIKTQEFDLIVHAAAYTDVQKAESDKLNCFQVNVYGTLNLLNTYSNTPFVYISTEYAHKPINFYSLTKWFAEELVKRHPYYLIIRTLFKPTPWPYEKAFIDQWTEGDSVDIIASMIEEEIKNWNRKSKRFITIGTGRKRIYDIAVKTKPDVIPNSIKEMTVPIPGDYR